MALTTGGVCHEPKDSRSNPGNTVCNWSHCTEGTPDRSKWGGYDEFHFSGVQAEPETLIFTCSVLELMPGL